MDIDILSVLFNVVNINSENRITKQSQYKYFEFCVLPHSTPIHKGRVVSLRISMYHDVVNRFQLATVAHPNNNYLKAAVIYCLPTYD